MPTGYRRGPSVDTVCGQVVFPRDTSRPTPLSPSPPPPPATYRTVQALRPTTRAPPPPCKSLGTSWVLAAVSGCTPCPTSKRMSSNQHLAAQGQHYDVPRDCNRWACGKNCCETMARVAGADPLGPSSMSSRMCKKTPGSDCLGRCLPVDTPSPYPTHADKLRALSEHVR